MCGIIGIIGKQTVAPLLVEGLRRLEYRGYDSAGVATLVNGSIERRRAQGKLVNLEDRLEAEPVTGMIGIGHTRWATHGVPNEDNAHPHATSRVAVVHNGIIENFQELREELSGAGHNFETDTDTEVIVHLVDGYLADGSTPSEAVARALPRLEGAFALVIIFADEHDLMIGARRGSPLAIGYGAGEMYFDSDALALAPLTQRICYLEEGDWAEVTSSGAKTRNAAGDAVERPIVQTALSGAMIGKGDYRHFMEKEIHERRLYGDTLHSMLNPATQTINLPPTEIDLTSVPSVSISACGTAYYAGLVTQYWIESLASIPVMTDIASEFRYRQPPMTKGGLSIFVSQSGETMDTLEALRYAAAQHQRIVSVVNSPESSIARESDAVLKTLAGPEIGVASTKAFTTQLTVLACFAIALAKARGAIDREREAQLTVALAEVPGRASEILHHNDRIAEIARDVSDARDVLNLGRGTSYPIALEGALKLKEISYIHAEAYAAGEMKHGPIALIDEDVPVIVIALGGDPLFDKTAANVQEAGAGGSTFLSDGPGVAAMQAQAKPWASITLPTVDPFVAPIIYAIPVQLLAYAAVVRHDVDQPRNLAKSVTVE